jgi:hypothetical protein
MKRILLFGCLIAALSSCQNEQSDPTSEEPTEANTTVTPDEQEDVTGDIYAQDWELFKQAVISKDKDAVLFFATKNDQSLIDVLDLSYDYIFDDQMIENIENMNYEDLPASPENQNWKELSTYYFGEVDGEIFESGTFLYFEERPEGLRIVNFLAAG